MSVMSAPGIVRASSNMRRGVNLVEDPAAPFGSPQARASFAKLKQAGASSVALIPFFWQPGPDNPEIMRGSALPNDRLRKGIIEAREFGFRVLVKPHVWVPEAWAGSVGFDNEDNWARWFANYRSALLECAQVAADARASTFCVGTELLKTSGRPEWQEVIAQARDVFGGQLTYTAHNSAEVEQVGFWDDLDVVTMSSYPPLGAPADALGRRTAMMRELNTLHSIAEKHGKPAWLGEIGIRSARGATHRPWESAEERDAAPDLVLQKNVLEDWLAQATRKGIDTALIWRWISDPESGGPDDTDFTIQNKPAQSVLRG